MALNLKLVAFFLKQYGPCVISCSIYNAGVMDDYDWYKLWKKT